MPVEQPLQKLSAWIYLSGPHYSMHDSCKDAIEFDESMKLKITNYIVKNFSRFIQFSDDTQTYLLGLFIGKNADKICSDSKTETFLPIGIYNYAKTNRFFEEGLGHGIGEVFPLLDQELQENILKRVEIDIQLANALGDSLGINFEHISEEHKNKVLAKVSKSIIFARYFGQSIGRVIFHMSQGVSERNF